MAESNNHQDREIVSSRVFHMPREAIFKAFADKKQLGEWWGPHGFRNTIHAIDYSPGGRWKFTMHGPDGTDYLNECEFVEYVEPVRVIFDHLQPVHGFRMTMTFDEQDQKTKLRWAMLFESKDECQRIQSYVTIANEQNFERLERHLAHVTGESISTSTSANEIRVSRVYDAPRDLVFDVWTDPKHLAHWWGPNGFSISTHGFQFQPGGVWQFDMHGPDGRDYPNRIRYTEIVRPTRLVYSHGGEPNVEKDLFNTVVTFEESDDKTYLTMKATFANAEERDRVIRDYGAAEGGKQTLERLGRYIASQ
ncbi:MAG: SRPBCC family protein [Gemmataceae bacterium]